MADPLDLPIDQERGLREAIKRFFSAELDEDLGDLRASLVLDFFRRELAPAFYNRGVTIARAYLDDRLLDLEPTCHVAPPPPPKRRR